MASGSRVSTIPGLAPPPVLIFFHIPKTGGLTMAGVVQHCLPNQYFDCELYVPDTALWVRSTAKIAEKFKKMPEKRQRDVRCVVGDHVSMDVARIFDKPSKFFTILREPVDRVISSFYFGRTRPELPSHPYIKDMTLEEYLDSGFGLDYDNQQVRMLSGCAELDSPWGRNGRPVSRRPVKRHYLEKAKRNIEKHFIVAAPLEMFTHLIWFLKRLYGWPTHLILFRRQNETPGRPSAHAVSESTRKRLETLNRYDIELYEWVKDRFMKQIEPLEPEFSREVRRLEMLNSAFQRVRPFIPQPVHAAMKHLVWS
jgi:Galactose-3-O-sulfotransferase